MRFVTSKLKGRLTQTTGQPSRSSTTGPECGRTAGLACEAASPPEHMPSLHRAQAEWTSTAILAWAEKLGPAMRQLADELLRERPHQDQGFRSCFGILRLAKRYGDDRVEAACCRAIGARARSYWHVESS